MEELSSLCNYQENFGELNLKLQYTTMELESAKIEANEQIRKYREEVKLLLNLLKLAYQERDEARDQLQKLLNKLVPSSPTELIQPMVPHHPQAETPLMIAAKTNSSITESSSLSDTYNHQSHGSSPVDSLFDHAVTSPDFPNINMAESGRMGFVNQAHQPFVQEYNNGCLSTGLVSPGVTKVDDPASTVIGNFAKGKTLPAKGKLLQAVIEAGPLLQTLLVAGPLPRWRNPPSETVKIPPVSIQAQSKSAAANPNTTILQKPLNSSSSYPEMTCGSRQVCSAAILNFASSVSASGVSNSQLLSSGAGFNTQITAGKRRKFE